MTNHVVYGFDWLLERLLHTLSDRSALHVRRNGLEASVYQ